MSADAPTASIHARGSLAKRCTELYPNTSPKYNTCWRCTFADVESPRKVPGIRGTILAPQRKQVQGKPSALWIKASKQGKEHAAKAQHPKKPPPRRLHLPTSEFLHSTLLRPRTTRRTRAQTVRKATHHAHCIKLDRRQSGLRQAMATFCRFFWGAKEEEGWLRRWWRARRRWWPGYPRRRRRWCPASGDAPFRSRAGCRGGRAPSRWPRACPGW